MKKYLGNSKVIYLFSVKKDQIESVLHSWLYELEIHKNRIEIRSSSQQKSFSRRIFLKKNNLFGETDLICLKLLGYQPWTETSYLLKKIFLRMDDINIKPVWSSYANKHFKSFLHRKVCFPVITRLLKKYCQGIISRSKRIQYLLNEKNDDYLSISEMWEKFRKCR